MALRVMDVNKINGIVELTAKEELTKSASKRSMQEKKKKKDDTPALPAVSLKDHSCSSTAGVHQI